jgi:2'-5' RNA ligase
MHLFLALKVPEINFTDQRFARLNSNFEKRKIQYRSIPAEQLYIPLLELSDMGQSGLIGVVQRLKSKFYDMEAFDLKLKGLWAYPHQHEADMLWINVQNSKQLRFIQEESKRELDLDDEALSRPHLPIIYLEEEKDVADLISPFKNIDFGSVKITEVIIIEKLKAPLGVRMMASFSLRDRASDHEIQSWV